MFTRTSTYTNTTGSWTTVEEANTQINALLNSTKTEEDHTKITELQSNDLSWSEPTLSEDGTTVSCLITASQHALDVFDGLTETAGDIAQGSTITKTVTDWTPVGE